MIFIVAFLFIKFCRLLAFCKTLSELHLAIVFLLMSDSSPMGSHQLPPTSPIGRYLCPLHVNNTKGWQNNETLKHEDVANDHLGNECCKKRQDR